MSYESGSESGNDTGNQAARVGFCQDCGRPLTRETARAVGSGMFCEPCLERRLAAAGAFTAPPANPASTAPLMPGASPEAGTQPGAGQPAYTTVPPVAGAGSAGPAPPGSVPPGSGPLGSMPLGSMPPGTMPALGGDNPSPVLAGLLGFIPGVGAFYNGQFAKGIAHLVIFFVLESMSHVSELFGLLASLWCLYQAYEAYHTARARREGRPLPDPFGLNDIGERMGIFANFQGGASRPWAAPPSGPAAPSPSAAAAPGTSTAYTASPGTTGESVPPGTTAWQPVAPPPQSGSAGYSSSSGTGAATPPGTPPIADPAYAPVFTPPAASPPTGLARFPAAAVWLIGLGVVFLLFTVDSERWSMKHMGPFLLAAFAVWIFLRRLSTTGGIPAAEGEGRNYLARIVHALRLPALLLTLAVLLALQSYSVAWRDSTWPVLLIAFGAQLLAERAVGRPVAFIAAAPYAAADATTASVNPGSRL